MAITAAVKAKAAKAANKSESMRILLEAGMPVKDVAAETGVPYGFAYGVARRAGLLEGNTEKREAKPKAAKASKPAKAAPKASAKATTSKAPRAAAAKASAKAGTKRTAAKA